MGEYTELECMINGRPYRPGWGQIIPVEIKKVVFFGFDPTDRHLSYYRLAQNKETEISELVCEVIAHHGDLPLELNEGNLIRAYMDRQIMVIANRIEKMGATNENEKAKEKRFKATKTF